MHDQSSIQLFQTAAAVYHWLGQFRIQEGHGSISDMHPATVDSALIQLRFLPATGKRSAVCSQRYPGHSRVDFWFIAFSARTGNERRIICGCSAAIRSAASIQNGFSRLSALAGQAEKVRKPFRSNSDSGRCTSDVITQRLPWQVQDRVAPSGFFAIISRGCEPAGPAGLT